jgi:hypothetical protein
MHRLHRSRDCEMGKSHQAVRSESGLSDSSIHGKVALASTAI